MERDERLLRNGFRRQARYARRLCTVSLVLVTTVTNCTRYPPCICVDRADYLEMKKECERERGLHLTAGQESEKDPGKKYKSLKSRAKSRRSRRKGRRKNRGSATGSSRSRSRSRSTKRKKSKSPTRMSRLKGKQGREGGRIIMGPGADPEYDPDAKRSELYRE